MREPRFLPFVLLACAFLSSCGTVNPGKTVPHSGVVPEYAGEWAAVPENILRNILLASPESLSTARDLLRELPGSVQVDSAVYTVDYLFYMLYPEMSVYVSGGPVPFPAIRDTVLPLIVDSIRLGTFPDIPPRQVDVVSMMLSSLVLLTAKETSAAEQASEMLDRFEKLVPESLLPSFLHAVTAERAGMFDEAVVFYDKTIALSATCYPAIIAKARILSGRGVYAGIPDLLHGVTVPQGRNRELSKLLAEAYFHNGNYTEAEKYLNASLQMDPAQPVLLFMRAELEAGRGNWNGAIRSLDEGEKLQPFPESKRYLKAVVISHSPSRIREAVSLLERSKELSEKNRDAMELYGKLLFQTGDRIRGKRILTEVVEMAPERSDLGLMLFREYVKDGEWNAALRYAPEVVKADVSDDLRSEVYTVYRMNGRKEQALEVLSLLYRKNPGQEKLLMEYILLLYDLKKNDEFLTVLDLSLGGSLSGSSRSELYFLRSTLQKKPDKRLADIRSSLIEDPFNVKALASLARIHREAKEYRRAYLLMKEASRLAPKDDAIRKEFEELKRLSGL